MRFMIMVKATHFHAECRNREGEDLVGWGADRSERFEGRVSE